MSLNVIINSCLIKISIYLDIIQEIRSAHKLMEQTLESKLNSFNANKNEIIVSNFRVILKHILILFV